MTTLKPLPRRSELEWVDLALDRADDLANPAKNILGGAAIGVALLLLGNPVGGIAVAGYFIWQAFKAADAAADASALARDQNCVAPLLEGQDFRRFTLEAGPEETARQIQYALECGVKPTATASAFLGRHQRGEVASPPIPPPARQTVDDPDQLKTESADETPPTPAQQLPPGHPAALLATPTEHGVIRSWFICGLPGAGKGTLFSVAIDEFLRQWPRAEIWLVDPKGDPAEAHYWSRCHRVFREDCQDPELDSEELAMALKEFISGYHASRARPKLLIVDELPALSTVLPSKMAAMLRNYLSNLASMGRSRQAIAWLSTQAVGVSENGLTITSKDSFSEMYLINSETAPKITRHPSYRWNKSVSRQLVADGARACLLSVDNKWRPIPREYAAMVAAKAKQPAPVPPADAVVLAAARQQSRHRQSQAGTPSPKPSIIDEAISEHPEGSPIRDFLIWLKGQRDAGKRSINWEHIRVSRWNTPHGKSETVLGPCVQEALSLGLISEIADRQYTITDWP